MFAGFLTFNYLQIFGRADVLQEFTFFLVNKSSNKRFGREISAIKVQDFKSLS